MGSHVLLLTPEHKVLSGSEFEVTFRSEIAAHCPRPPLERWTLTGLRKSPVHIIVRVSKAHYSTSIKSRSSKCTHKNDQRYKTLSCFLFS